MSTSQLYYGFCVKGIEYREGNIYFFVGSKQRRFVARPVEAGT